MRIPARTRHCNRRGSAVTTATRHEAGKAPQPGRQAVSQETCRTRSRTAPRGAGYVGRSFLAERPRHSFAWFARSDEWAVRAGMSVGTVARANQSRTTPARRLLSGFRLPAVVLAAVICGHARTAAPASSRPRPASLKCSTRSSWETGSPPSPSSATIRPKCATSRRSGTFCGRTSKPSSRCKPDLVVLLKEQGTLADTAERRWPRRVRTQAQRP